MYNHPHIRLLTCIQYIESDFGQRMNRNETVARVSQSQYTWQEKMAYATFVAGSASPKMSALDLVPRQTG